MEAINMELIQNLPVAWANYLSIFCFIFLAISIWLIPKEALQLDSQPRSILFDLRWWATTLIILQLFIYWVFN